MGSTALISSDCNSQDLDALLAPLILWNRNDISLAEILDVIMSNTKYIACAKSGLNIDNIVTH